MTDSKAVITDEMVQRALVGFGPFSGSMKNEQEKMRAALEAALTTTEHKE